MKIKLSAILLLLVSLTSSARAEDLPPMPQGPLILTTVKQEMLSPDYWISRIPDADVLLKTPEQMAEFNDDIHAMIRDCVDMFKIGSTKSGQSVRDQIELEYKAIRGRGLYDSRNLVWPKTYFDENIKPVIQTAKVPAKIQIRWGVATRATSVRALPTTVKMFEKKDDPEFDMLQFTLIKLWTPVGILHESSDGKWVYLQAPYTRGWVRKKDIAMFANRSDIKKFVKPANPKSFLMVTGDHIPVFSDPAVQSVSQMVSMGTILPIKSKETNNYVVWLPHRKEDGGVRLGKGYVRVTSDVSVGFLPYTKRNVIEQAFKLLGARYGWGGTYGGRDCSGFTHDVLLTFGIDMPRGSKQQGFVGTQINHFKPFEDAEGKVAAIRSAMPGLTLLRMPSHQMLYLGEVNGEFYAIHCTWAERISMTSDEKNRINQVVVSDLTLNGNSRIGSLFDRIISVNELN